MPVNQDIVPESTYLIDEAENTRTLWLGVLAGPIVYSLYFIAGYLLAEVTCKTDWVALQPMNLDWFIGGMTVLAALLTLATTIHGYRTWQRHCERRDDVGEALAFMAWGGFLLSLLFTLLIGVTGVAVFFVTPCAWV